jgi:hypothetical protein
MPDSIGEQFLRKSDVQRRIHGSLSKVNRLLAAGALKARKEGRTVLIEAASLEGYLQRLPDATFRRQPERGP